jgi:hypothetical protein
MPTKKTIKLQEELRKKCKPRVKSSRIKTKNQRSNPFFHPKVVELTRSLEKAAVSLDEEIQSLAPSINAEINRTIGVWPTKILSELTLEVMKEMTRMKLAEVEEKKNE